MTKINSLTRETRSMWSGIDRSAKNGDFDRAYSRSAQWAIHKFGLNVPADAKLIEIADPDAPKTTSWTFKVVRETTVWGRTRRIEREYSEPLVAPFKIPAWCQAVKSADAWHEAFQLGCDLADCHRVGMGYDTLDRITAPEQLELAA